MFNLSVVDLSVEVFKCVKKNNDTPNLSYKINIDIIDGFQALTCSFQFILVKVKRYYFSIHYNPIYFEYL